MLKPEILKRSQKNARKSMAGKSLIEGVRHILNDSPREAV